MLKMKKLLNSLKSQRGISGVVVAMMLVGIGAAAVLVLKTQVDSVQDATGTQLESVITQIEG
jgi:hypothetical protein